MADLRHHHLSGLSAAAWEAAWAPYDADTYQAALSALGPEDVVLDIGAGDLRFAAQAAAVCRRVIAVERNPAVLPPPPWPARVAVVTADAREWPFPAGVTVGVLLMRHCRHYPVYAAKLRAAGCRRLVTNARWGLGVEVVALDAPPQAFDQARGRWYACACGAAGFAPGPPEGLRPEHLWTVVEVAACPACTAGGPATAEGVIIDAPGS